MKTFIADIFPKIERYSQKLDNLTLLTNQHWVSIDEIINSKTVYIFRDNKELLVSTNGQVEKAKWDYLGNKSLLIDKSDKSYLFKHGFFDENILALKSDGSDEYAVFVNENKYDGDLNSFDKVIGFLKENYLDTSGIPILIKNHQNLETKNNVNQNDGLFKFITYLTLILIIIWILVVLFIWIIYN